MEYLIILVPFLFALFNRWRGASPFTTWGKVGAITILTGLLYAYNGVGLAGWQLLWCLLPAPLYYVGSTYGWGKWVGSLLERTERFKHEEEGHTVFKIFGKTISFWDGIHHLANLIVKEDKDYLNYCRVALAIRSIWWWLPVLVPFVIFQAVSWWIALVWIVPMALAFPASEDLALELKLKLSGKEGGYNKYKKTKTTYTEIAWAYAEYIYGFFIGLCFAIMLFL